MNVTTTVVIVIALVAVALVVLAVLATRGNRSRRLRERFGPEYDRAVSEEGDPKRAERTLQERVNRREQLQIRDLAPDARARYAESWRAIQTQFVDDPRGAVREADVLVVSVMRERGYPTEGFDQQAADVSVDHAGVVSEYRSAHQISAADSEGRATTDDLRQAMVHYRALFQELLGEPASQPRRTQEVK